MFALLYLKNNISMLGSGKIDKEWIFTDYIIKDKSNIKPHVILTNILHSILYADWKKYFKDKRIEGETPSVDDVKEILSEDGQNIVNLNPEIENYITNVCSIFTELKNFHDSVDYKIRNSFLLMQSEYITRRNRVYIKSIFNVKYLCNGACLSTMDGYKLYDFQQKDYINQDMSELFLFISFDSSDEGSYGWPYKNYFIKDGNDIFDLKLTKRRFEVYLSFSCSQWVCDANLVPYIDYHIIGTNIENKMTDDERFNYLKLEPFDDYNNRYHLFDFVVIA